MKLTNVSIDNRTSVFILAVLIIIGGLWTYNSLPRESSPDINIPLIIVSTPYFGVSPSDIESLITQPIEKEINGISDIKAIKSSSFEGVSIIQAEFESGVDIDDALQKVRDKVNKAESELPDDVEKPIITEINFSEFPILTFNISGPQGLVTLKEIADDIKDDIETVEGILDVKIRGGLEREVQVNVNINKLVHYNIRFDDVIGAIRDENKTIPGGSIDMNTSSFLVRIPGEFDKPFIIEDLIVKLKEGKPIYVKDVAEVKYAFKDRDTYARLNEVDCVTLDVTKRVGANIIDITDEVKEIIARYDEELPQNIAFTITVDQSDDIRRTVKNLENNVVSGLILVVMVLFVALGVRNAMFVAIAIPLSMFISFIFMSAIGMTLNMIVLFSLILALGMLVDNAIVIIENIYKFLEEGDNLISAAKKGAAEVAWPITTSTMTTIMAFGPILFWQGVMGDFMKFLPATLIITLASSLFVALVINPVFASVFMKLEQKGKKPDTLIGKMMVPLNKITHYFVDVLLPKTIEIYEKFLNASVDKPREKGKPISLRSFIGFGLFIVALMVMMSPPSEDGSGIPNLVKLLIAVIIAVVIKFIVKNNRLRILSGALIGLFGIMNLYAEFDHGVELFPTVDPPRVYINVESPPGTNVEMSNRIAHNIEKKLEPFLEADVKEYIANVGVSNNPFEGGNKSTPNKSTITVQFIDYEERSKSSALTTEDIRKVVSNIAGAEIEVKKQDMGPPVGKPVNVEISGDDFEILGSLAEQIKEVIKDTPGLVNLKDDYDAGRPELKVVVNREKAALYSLNTSMIANNIRTAINGFTASKYRINEDEYDITVRLLDSQRSDVDALKNLRVNYNNKQGKALSVPLSSVADVVYDKGLSAIRRVDLKRVVTVSAENDASTNANDVLLAVMDKLKDFNLPPNYNISYTGENEEMGKAMAFLGKAFLIAALGIFLILVIQFNSLSQPLVIMGAVLISLIGVFIGLIVYEMPFGVIMTGIGVISLIGVVVNNNIVLIDYTNILRKKGFSAHEAVIKAGLRRFRPVTLTAITTILGLIPLTFGFGFDFSTFSFESGGVDAAFWRSMGIAVIFGLMFGTILTLIIVPVMYSTVSDMPDAFRSTWNKFIGKKNNK